MDERTLVRKSVELLRKDLNLDTSFSGGEEKTTDQLHKLLTRVVQEMLDRDFERLLNALYRIDVSEKEVRQILELSPADAMASDLAFAIIRREQAKVKTRLAFS